MKTYTVTYDHNVYKPSNYDAFKKQQQFILTIEAKNIEDCKKILREKHNLNPTYFKIK